MGQSSPRGQEPDLGGEVGKGGKQRDEGRGSLPESGGMKN
jgi:hypothetical protein